MNFQQLLHQRDALLRQARLANLAFACEWFGVYASRIARARLQGPVTLHPAEPEEGQPWPRLAANEGSQAVLEEHFLDEEVVELTDILRFLGEDIPSQGYLFRLEELVPRFLPQLRDELRASGVVLPGAPDPIEDPNRRSPS
jgi:hypothetical protein